jgi:hypothetical protein
MNLIAESANKFKKSIESNGNVFADIYGISSNADEANKILLQSESPADFIKVMPASFEIPKDGDKIKYNLTPLEYKDLESIFKFKLNDLMEGDITEKSLKNKVEHAYDYAVKTMRKKLGA